MHVGAIVEGEGEERAFPVLFRRIAHASGEYDYELHKPFRLPRTAFAFEDGIAPNDRLERAILFLARKPGLDRILLLADADDEKGCKLAPQLVAYVHAVAPHVRSAVILPVREYEAWFLAAIESLRGVHGVRSDAVYTGDPETVRDAKGALQNLLEQNRYYRPTADQPALTSKMDFGQARRTYSFHKLERECARILSP